MNKSTMTYNPEILDPREFLDLARPMLTIVGIAQITDLQFRDNFIPLSKNKMNETRTY
jgi:hypothetical protein